MAAIRAALVTGGSRGIGRAVVVALERSGYAVGVNYVSNETAAIRLGSIFRGGEGLAQAGLVPQPRKISCGQL